MIREEGLLLNSRTGINGVWPTTSVLGTNRLPREDDESRRELTSRAVRAGRFLRPSLRAKP